MVGALLIDGPVEQSQKLLVEASSCFRKIEENLNSTLGKKKEAQSFSILEKQVDEMIFALLTNKIITLPDGSVVELNINRNQIDYFDGAKNKGHRQIQNFKDLREVILTGINVNVSGQSIPYNDLDRIDWVGGK